MDWAWLDTFYNEGLYGRWWKASHSMHPRNKRQGRPGTWNVSPFDESCRLLATEHKRLKSPNWRRVSHFCIHFLHLRVWYDDCRLKFATLLNMNSPLMPRLFMHKAQLPTWERRSLKLHKGFMSREGLSSKSQLPVMLDLSQSCSILILVNWMPKSN